ncbi:MAG: TIGR00266 family protein [Halanaerobiales bacterium]|nr:TIGR00266 family protein [Halanaerobiales bacterium]
MKSDVIDYEVLGDDMQVVEIELDPQETVIAEAGGMNWMDSGIDYEAKMGDGSELNKSVLNKVFGAGKRLISGESIFLTHFTNRKNIKSKIAFAAPYPGKIIPLELSELPNKTFTCQKDAFLCAAKGTKLDITFNKRIGSGLFGGEGFILEKITGDGRVFLHAGGTVVKKELDGEMLKVDTGCLVGFTDGIDYNIQKAGKLKTMLFGGEGLFLATLHGKGTVYLQSLPFSRLADRILKSAPRISGNKKGEGSVLGKIGGFIDGDNFI